jgi:hypothetical protein
LRLLSALVFILYVSLGGMVAVTWTVFKVMLLVIWVHLWRWCGGPLAVRFDGRSPRVAPGSAM